MHVIGAPVGLGTTDLGQWKFIKKGVKKVGRGVATGARAVGKGVKTVGAKAAAVALYPLRAVVNRITSRRARKLAWDRRRSTRPTPAEGREAKNWTKAQFRAKGYHGKLIAALAGAEDSLGGDMLGLDPATLTAAAAIAAALTQLAKTFAKQAAASGEAPEDPTKGGPLPEITIAPTPEAQAAVTEFVEEASKRSGAAERFAEEAQQAAETAAETIEGYFGQAARHSTFVEPTATTPAVTKPPTDKKKIALLAGLGLAVLGGVFAASGSPRQPQP